MPGLHTQQAILDTTIAQIEQSNVRIDELTRQLEAERQEKMAAESRHQVQRSIQAAVMTALRDLVNARELCINANEEQMLDGLRKDVMQVLDGEITLHELPEPEPESNASEEVETEVESKVEVEVKAEVIDDDDDIPAVREKCKAALKSMGVEIPPNARQRAVASIMEEQGILKELSMDGSCFYGYSGDNLWRRILEILRMYKQ